MSKKIDSFPVTDILLAHKSLRYILTHEFPRKHHQKITSVQNNIWLNKYTLKKAKGFILVSAFEPQR